MPKNSGVEEGFRMAWNHVGRGQETGMNKFWDVIAAVTLLGILPRRGKVSGRVSNGYIANLRVLCSG